MKTLNAAQNEVLAALKSGATLRQSNRTSLTDNGTVHHATVRVLVNAGAVVLNADKTLSLTASNKQDEKANGKASKASGRAALVEALAFATERVATCERMVKNGTCTRERLAQWQRKVTALTAELAAW